MARSIGDYQRMKVGDLVEYKGVHEYGPIQKHQLGTITRISTMGSLLHPETQYYIIWHTTDNKGWWSGKALKLANRTENESR